MANLQELATAFIHEFYTLFNATPEGSRRAQVAQFYTEQSIATIQQVEKYGREAIMAYWLEESLSGLVKIPENIIAQMSVGGLILILSQGRMTLAEDELPIVFTEVITLLEDPGSGAYFIVNQIQSTHGI
jgi:hypothetical protein